MICKILFIESGRSGGGSFESLYEYLKSCNRDKFKPYVIFFNKTKYFDLIRKLDIECFLISDPLLTHKQWNKRSFIQKIAEKSKICFDLLCPVISLFIEKIIHLSTIKRIKDIIVKNDINIIHTNNQANRDLYAIQCASLTKKPCIVHLRSFFSLGFNKTKAGFTNRVVSKFIAYSHSIAIHWVKNGIDSNKIEVIHNAIGEINPARPNLYKLFNIPSNVKIIGIVGSLIPARGHDFLIKSFKVLKEIQDNVALLIIGTGDKKHIGRLKKIVKRLNISNSVYFVGHYPDAKEIIASLEILVLPYSIEPFGRVMLEAWFLKKPVIATDIGEIKKIVNPGNNIILVKYGDIQNLKNSMLELLNNKELYKKITENAYQTCLSDFSIKTYKDQIEKIYENIVSNW